MTSISSFKASINLIELIAQTVDLKKEGRGYLGCCPLHGERTPSLHVNEKRWKCFGCHKGGDAINWVAELHQCSIKDACAMLSGPTSFSSKPPQTTSTPDFMDMEEPADLDYLIMYWDLPNTLEGKLEAMRRIGLMSEINFNPLPRWVK